MQRLHARRSPIPNLARRYATASCFAADGSCRPAPSEMIPDHFVIWSLSSIASASFRPMICSSVNRNRFICPFLLGSNSHRVWRKIRGVTSYRKQLFISDGLRSWRQHLNSQLELACELSRDPKLKDNIRLN